MAPEWQDKHPNFKELREVTPHLHEQGMSLAKDV
jgi:hypothetical protein